MVILGEFSLVNVDSQLIFKKWIYFQKNPSIFDQSMICPTFFPYEPLKPPFIVQRKKSISPIMFRLGCHHAKFQNNPVIFLTNIVCFQLGPLKPFF